MSLLTPRDFSNAAVGNLSDRDIDGLIAEFNTAMNALGSNQGGGFDWLANNFNGHVQRIVPILIDAANEYLNCGDWNQIRRDVVTSTIAVVISKSGCNNHANDDWIVSEFNNNPILINLQQQQQQQRNYGNNNRYGNRNNGNRYGNNQGGGSGYQRTQSRNYNNQGGYNNHNNGGSGYVRPSYIGNNRNNGNRYGNNQSGGNNAYVNTTSSVIGGDTNNQQTFHRRPQTEQQPQQGYGRNKTTEQQPMEPAMGSTPQVNDDVITSKNFADLNESVGPLYLYGTTVNYANGEFKIQRDNMLDYEDHRIDKYFPDLLGESDVSGALQALMEIKQAHTEIIEGFVKQTNSDKEKQKEDQPLTFNKNLFKDLTRKGELDYDISYLGRHLDPSDIRDEIITNHNITIADFSKLTIGVKAKQFISLGKITNDALLHLNVLTKPKQSIFDLAGALYKLYELIDGASWKFIHDELTNFVNYELVKANIGMTIDSITADAAEFREYLKGLKNPATQLVVDADNLTSRFSVITEKEETVLVLNHNLIFLPTYSGELPIFRPANLENDTFNDYAVVLPGSDVNDIFKDLNYLDTGVQIVFLDNTSLLVSLNKDKLNPTIYTKAITK